MATDREAWTQGRERGTLTLLSSGYEIVHQARRVQTDADFILSYPNASHPIASSLSSPLSYHLSYSSVYLHFLSLGFFTVFFFGKCILILINDLCLLILGYVGMRRGGMGIDPGF